MKMETHTFGDAGGDREPKLGISKKDLLAASTAAWAKDIGPKQM